MGDGIGRTKRSSRAVRRMRGALTILWAGRRSEPESGWDVRNETPWPIWVQGAQEVLCLAPLEQRTIKDLRSPATRRRARDAAAGGGVPDPCEPVSRYGLRALVERRQLTVQSREPDSEATGELAGVLRCASVGAFVWVCAVLVVPRPMWVAVGLVFGAALVVTVFLLTTRPGRLHDARRVRRWTWQSLTMGVILAVAVAGPALALWWGTSLHDEMRLRARPPWVQALPAAALIPRLLQLTLISTASLLPALMFFQFDAERLSTMRDRWMQNIFRIDPTLATVSDVEAKYGRQLEEAYGQRSDGRGRLTRGRRSPLIVATVAITFGWLVILLNTDPVLAPGAAGTGGKLDPVSLITPRPTTMTYAFLGAYFFGLNLVHNAYVRGDLRPKTYNLITTRILFAVILGWLISLAMADVASNWFAYGVAFAAGIVPRTVLHWLGELLDSAVVNQGNGSENRRRKGAFTALEEVVSSGEELTTLDGIDLYERTRLSDEGITTLQALVHHDLVDLFFKTRIAPPRLIDWVDQAVLQLYFADVSGAGRARDIDAVKALRRLGVRTATDFIDAVRNPAERPVVRGALLVQGRTAKQVNGCVVLLEQTLSQSEWANRIRRWKHSELTAVKPQERKYIGGDGILRAGDPRFSVPASPEPRKDQPAPPTAPVLTPVFPQGADGAPDAGSDEYEDDLEEPIRGRG